MKPISDFILRRLADLVFFIRKGQHQETAADLAREWQRMFPSKAFVPIRRIDGETAYADILGTCPVTAGGDLTACHRLMEYDRRLLQQMGGQFVVLESKADPALRVCRIAIRRQGVSTDDLTPAHRQSPNNEQAKENINASEAL